MGRVRPIRDGYRRRAAPRWSPEQWAEADRLLLRRARGCCDRCGRALSVVYERHHRMRRRDGGDRLSNLLALCSDCHQWITEHPKRSVEAGWIILANAAPRMNPEEVPVRIGTYGLMFLLTDDGRANPLP